MAAPRSCTVAPSLIPEHRFGYHASGDRGEKLRKRIELVKGKRALLETWELHLEECTDPVYLQTLKTEVLTGERRLKNYAPPRGVRYA